MPFVVANHLVDFDFIDRDNQTWATQSTLNVDFDGELDFRSLSGVIQGRMWFAFATDMIKDSDIFSMNFLSISDNNYIRFDNIPSLWFIDLAFLSQQRIKLDSSVSENDNAHSDDDMFDIQSQIDDNQVKAKQQWAIMREILSNSESFVFSRDKWDDNDWYHAYAVVFDQDVLIEFLNNESFRQDLVLDVIEDKSVVDAAYEALSQMVDNVEDLRIKLWIDPVTHLPYRLVLYLDLVSQEDIQFSWPIVVDFFMRDYNKKINIQTPSSFTTIKELLPKIFWWMFGSMAEWWWFDAEWSDMFW